MAIQNYIMKKIGYVYILFNKRNGTLYTGVTSNIVKRIYEHKNKQADGFTKKYSVDKLGYYEISDSIDNASSDLEERFSQLERKFSNAAMFGSKSDSE